MNPADLLSSEFTVRWDGQIDSLVIVHPDAKKFPLPHVQIRASTLDEMTFEQASQFIGGRLVLLIPALRGRYVGATTGEMRAPPKV